VPAEDVERVGLVVYCPSCAKEFREDAEIEALMNDHGCSEC